MSLITPFLNQTVATVYDSELNGYGDASYTATYQEFDTYPVPCRFVNEPKYSYTNVGVSQIAKAQAWMEADANISEGAKVRIDGESFEVVSILKKRNLLGEVEYLKVLLR